MRNSRCLLCLTGTALLLIGGGSLVAPPAHAKYIRPDLVNVPIERLTKNLAEQASKNPKDAGARFNLARVHAMAYALKSDTAQTWKDKEQDGAWFGYEPAHVPFQVVPSEDPDKLKAAREHLDKAIGLFDEVLKLEPNNLTAALGRAWCLDQAGDKAKAVAAYRQVIEESWAKEKDLKRANLGWRSVTAEAAGYLIRLLDAEKDGQEISTLQGRVAQMQKVPRPITPIVIPLRDGLSAHDLEDGSASVAFDADGTGLKKNWTWIRPEAGWLVHDPHRTGRITSGLQFFGGVSFWLFWDHGYQALAALDDNSDGQLAGPELAGLAIWQDRNRNGRCEPGEVRPVDAWGIVAISCQHERDATHVDRIEYSPQGVVFRDGSNRPTYDILLRPR